jgi:hypothetical protein
MRNLKGLAAQLYESNPELSRALLREWGVLEEINAYVLDRKLPAVPPEYEVLADEALSRMSDLVVETLESDIGQKYNSE